MKYNILENNHFYIKKGNYKISYAKLYIYLKRMKTNGYEEMKINLEDEKQSETFNLRLFPNDLKNRYVFAMDNGLAIIINKKKVYSLK